MKSRMCRLETYTLLGGHPGPVSCLGPALDPGGWGTSPFRPGLCHDRGPAPGRAGESQLYSGDGSAGEVHEHTGARWL
jgi:hypothetical protein